MGDLTRTSIGVLFLPLLQAGRPNHLLRMRQRKPVVIRYVFLARAASLASLPLRLAINQDHIDFAFYVATIGTDVRSDYGETVHGLGFQVLDASQNRSQAHVPEIDLPHPEHALDEANRLDTRVSRATGRQKYLTNLYRASPYITSLLLTLIWRRSSFERMSEKGLGRLYGEPGMP
ncbi:hypothetical protein EVAR_76967_1 [Eumeta japonica]|uniref:Uncharacterized protein n=1 Tax=Eumeta variegata TaxID=151549 RepID=A0A4C1SFD2_EUMVA|nr:hypothetical protein EVAR_76967_1 [Eumeta japonica]